MSGDKPADLDAMRRERDQWWKRECLWFRQYVRAGVKYRHARNECRRLSRMIWAAEAAQGQRIVLMDERDRIARQAESLGEAIRAMQGVREQMQDRLLAILVELQQRDALGTHDGESK